MAQTRLRDYQDPLGSFEHNLINLGVHFPGRFCGFDTIVFTGQLQFTINHNASGIRTFNNVGDPIGPLGVAMSNQGVMIVEDAPIPGLAIETNDGNANDRTDYLVINHQYLELTNGVAATYSVVKGSMLANIPPVLTAFQTLIGVISIPAQAATINLCTYNKASCPDSGDTPDAKLTVPNVYGATNVNRADNLYVTDPAQTINEINFWDVRPKANTYFIQPGNNVYIDALRITGGLSYNQDGCEINLVINQYVKIRNFTTIGNMANQGYGSIVFASRLATSTEVFQFSTVNVLQPAPGNANQYILSLIRIQGQWFVKSIDGVGFSTGNFASKMVLEVDMDIEEIPTYFDSTGLGLLTYSGWQICNGVRGTRDRRGRFPVMATNIPNNGAPALSAALLTYDPLAIGGEAFHILTTQEMPKHGHDVPIPVDVTSQNQNGNGKLTCGNDVDEPAPGPTLHSTITGGDQPHENRPPYFATLFIMKL